MQTFVIAEIGINHDGDISKAADLVRAAAASGASAVKFQCFWGKFPEHAHLELTPQEFTQLFDLAESCGLQWFATGFGQDEVLFLKSLGQRLWKVPSGMATCKRYLDLLIYAMGETHRVFLSTGMCTEGEVGDAVLHLRHRKRDLDLCVMQCTTEYPCPPEHLNLQIIPTLRDVYPKTNTGLSDHSNLLWPPVVAVALGATVIEKHLTYDTLAKGPDHAASITPPLFKEMVDMISGVEVALVGDCPVKTPTTQELKIRATIREENAQCL